MVEIYLLLDPRDHTVRYVGQSKNAFQRFHTGHLIGIPSLRMITWLDDLRKLQKRPMMKVIATVCDDSADLAERLTIVVCRELGCCLLNKVWNP